MPSTPFIGVRISWLMRARVKLFAWFAASAASRAGPRRFSAALVLHDIARHADLADALWFSSSKRRGRDLDVGAEPGV